MASPKLTNEQRSQLLTWLAADYDYSVISQAFKDLDWPEISRQAVSYYRRVRDEGVKRLRAERYASALTTGLATKAERVERLKKHADKLELIKWQTDKNGRLWNEKAWRETLADIASEMGHRKQVIEISDPKQAILQLMQDLGLTIEDVRSDRSVAEFFKYAGIEIGDSEATLNATRGVEAPDTA